MSLSELLASYGLPASAIPIEAVSSTMNPSSSGERSITRKRRYNGNATLAPAGASVTTQGNGTVHRVRLSRFVIDTGETLGKEMLQPMSMSDG